MPVDPCRYRRNRAVFATVCLATAIAIGFLIWPGRVLETRSVAGVVVELNAGEGRSLRTGSGVRLVTARIVLENGQQVRVLASRAMAGPGEAVTLRESRYADGSLRYRIVE